MRRKLFSDSSSTTRRKLFSDGGNKVTASRRKLFSNDDCGCQKNEKVVKCMDCNATYKYSGSDLHLICTKCGSDRFEFLDNITDHSQSDNIENPINKAFSEKKSALTWGKSMDGDTELPQDLTYKCPDCSTEFKSKENLNLVNCPSCGGNRSRLEEVLDQDQNTEELEKGFSESNDSLDELLTKYKGKSVSENEIESELHKLGIYEEVGGITGLVDKGYAEEMEDGQVMFSDIADFQRKMFSKLVISVTKEFDIDPINNRELAINSLADKFPGKPIMILKRAQDFASPEVSTFSDKNYLRDSGIESDIRLGYGGQNMTIKEFMSLLSDEYPDAPEDIIDLLESSKVIKVNGGKVLISK